MITIVYKEGDRLVRVHDSKQLPALLAKQEDAFWVDFEAPSPEELSLLSDVFHFHPLAIEDAMNPVQRPKVEEYEGFSFITVDEAVLEEQQKQQGNAAAQTWPKIITRQIAMFLGPNYLVSVHRDPVQVVHNLIERCEHSERVFNKGADHFLYILLDTLVDGYFPLLDAIDDYTEDLEDRIIENPSEDVLVVIFGLKRDLSQLRKHVAPTREVLQALMTRDFPFIEPDLLPYLRDVADHQFRVYESLDNYRDLMSNMLDAYLSQVSNRMNRSMHKLSVVATVFMPLTFVTGFFGMNFTRQPWANTSVWLWTFIMLAIGSTTFWWFKRRHWT